MGLFLIKGIEEIQVSNMEISIGHCCFSEKLKYHFYKYQYQSTGLRWNHIQKDI